MIPELFVLALASTIRPTSLAAMYTLLGHKSSRALMLAYVLGGLAFTIVFGLVVVYALHGIHLHAGSGRTKAIAEIIGGVAALILALGMLTGRVHGRDVGEAPASRGRLKQLLDEHMTPRIAAVAGPVTHVPGVFYLIALNVIVAHSPRFVAGTAAVTTYNAVWFALPLAALLVCMTRPDQAREIVGSVNHWAQQHSRPMVLWTSLVVGVALVVRGVLAL